MKKIWRIFIIVLSYVCIMLTIFTYSQNLGLTVALALPVAIAVSLVWGAVFFLSEKEEFDAGQNGQ